MMGFRAEAHSLLSFCFPQGNVSLFIVKRTYSKKKGTFPIILSISKVEAVQ
jgi:hypothetical protein